MRTFCADMLHTKGKMILMKMNNPELEVVRFGAEDILTTSGAAGPKHLVTGTLGEAGSSVDYLCDHGTSKHYYITGQSAETNNFESYNYRPASKNGEYYLNVSINPSKFEDGTTPSAGSWYYYENSLYHFCSSN